MKYVFNGKEVYPVVKKKTVKMLITLQPVWNDLSEKTWGSLADQNWGTINAENEV